ncbi:MAG: exo-alpha-sialidase [SAR202 cluster bacterium]|nr:exo-alpha-sialidase [SAR202 cluster bacterium]
MPNVPMTLPQLALKVHGTQFFHWSTFAELEGGRVVHFAKGHVTYSDDGGITWTAPFEARDVNGNPVGASKSALVRLDGNAIGVAATMQEELTAALPFMRAYYLAFWRSEDGGRTWSAPTRISEPGHGSYIYQDVFLRTSSGRLVLPSYILWGQNRGAGEPAFPASGKLVRGQWASTGAHYFDPHFGTVQVHYSDDDGRTWRTNRDGDIMVLMESGIWSYCEEPSVTEVSPGRLLMIHRTGLGRHFVSWSHDNGETWTRPMPTPLATSTTPAQIRTLPNGHLLCIWNQETETEARMGYNRTRLSSAISRNGGSVWEFFQNIESLHETTRVEPGPIRYHHPEETHNEPGLPAPERDGSLVHTAAEHGRWSYPSVLVMKDRVLVAHTYTGYEDDEHEARLLLVGGGRGSVPGSFNQKLKVLPLEWFYGGKKPADNPFLKWAHEAAVS